MAGNTLREGRINMKVNHHNSSHQWIVRGFVFLALFCCWSDYGWAQTSNPSQDASVVLVKSWKRGDSKMPARVLTVKLQSDVGQYEFDIFSVPDKDKHFRLRLRESVENTLRTPGLPCWIADLREITKDHVSGANLVGYDLLSVEGPGVGDNFPREEWAGHLCPIEKPNRVLDGLFYPIRAERRFLIEGFVVGLQVTDYQIDKERKKLSNVELRITFANQ
jgi:hypothetical protein